MFGNIGWEINLQDTDLSVNTVALYISSYATGTGDIQWSLHGDDNSVKPILGSTWKTGDLVGSKRLVLTAVISSFKDSRSTRLLPACRDNADEGTTMRIEVKLQGEISITIFLLYFI